MEKCLQVVPAILSPVDSVICDWFRSSSFVDKEEEHPCGWFTASKVRLDSSGSIDEYLQPCRAADLLANRCWMPICSREYPVKNDSRLPRISKRETDMKSLIIIVLAIGVTLTTTVSGGCQTPNYQRNGTILGGLGGAGLGAAIGNKSQNALAGGLIGGAIGAIAGNSVGEGIDQDRAYAQQQAAQQGYAQGVGTQAARGAVSPQDVIAMSRAGLSEDVIATHVRTNGVTQQMQVNDLIYLRNQGVPDSVLQAMQQAPTSQARYNAAYTAAIPPPPPARPVVVEHVYPAYCPPPLYWHGYHHHGHHHGHHHHHRPSHVHWGISIGR
jgi:hypothetical protein